MLISMPKGNTFSRLLLSIFLPGFTEADGAQFYSKTIISTIDEAPGTARVPKCREETTQFDFLGFWCNHVVLEPLQAKNLPKRARDHQKSQNFRGF